MLTGWLNSEDELELGKEMEKGQIQSHQKYIPFPTTKVSKAWHTLYIENLSKFLTLMERWDQGRRKIKVRVPGVKI